MPTPWQLRQQDLANRMRERQARFNEMLLTQPDGPRKNRLQNRAMRADNRASRAELRLAQAQAGNTTQRLQNRRDYLAARQEAIQNRLDSGDYTKRRGIRLQRRYDRLGRRVDNADTALNAINTLPDEPTPPPPGPAIPTPQPGKTPPTTNGNLADLLKQYMPPSPGQDAANTFFTQGMARLNMQQPASYEDQFKNYYDVAQREAERQAAQLRESFGSRGARYGSDLLNAESDFRRKLAQDVAVGATDIYGKLNDQRMNELGALLPIQQAQNARDDKALAYLFSDFTRRTNPPPLLAGAGQYFTSFGPPTTVIS